MSLDPALRGNAPVALEGMGAGARPLGGRAGAFADWLRSGLYAACSMGLLLLVWQGTSWRVGSDVLPGPFESIAAVRDSERAGYLWSDILITAYRIAGAFLLALGASIVAGTLLGTSRVARRLFGPWVTITASIPALIYVVVAFLAIGLTDKAAMVATAFVVAPSMTFNVWDGMRAINPELQEMARVFGVPKRTMVRRVLLPQTGPFVFTAARVGLSLTWRIMIFVELLGLSSGVGYRIQYFFNVFQMKLVIAAALPFMMLMLAFEFGVLRPIEQWVFRWRRAETT
jgi:NitT/TauT family transport system permease protein